MYIHPHFRESDEETLLEFMRTYDFATVVSASAAGLVTSHFPVLVRPSGGSCVIVGRRTKSLATDFYDRMVGAIVAFEMTATKLEGTFKRGQNRSVEDRRRTIAALENEGAEGQSLAEFMRRRAGV